MKRFLFLACLCLPGPAIAGTSSPQLFVDGDRWAVVGDSLTHNGLWSTWVQAYYSTRFPNRAITVLNAGISGDTAGGALRRYDWDIQPKHATVATVLFGANDVNRSLYGADDVPPANLKRRADALDAYRRNIPELTHRLQADGTRVMLVTPPIFDDTAEGATPKQAGVNAALGECARFLREFGQSAGIEVLDIHTPMEALNQRLQQGNPSFSLMGADRVHTHAAGYLVMAYFFLKSQQAPADISQVVLDASRLRVESAVNARITALERLGASGLAFTSLEAALPFPIDPEARPALAWVPVMDDLNREILRVTGLPPGNYTLAIDGTPLRAFSADALAHGVNLAAEPSTPQNKQAAKVLALVKSLHWLVATRLRGVAQVEHREYPDTSPPLDFALIRPCIERRIEELKTGREAQASYYTKLYERYLTFKPQVKETQARVAKADADIRAAARPVEHRYTLTPVPAP